jgi:hypothetical protein
MSIAAVEFPKLATGHVIGCMQTIAHTRRVRLEMLIQRHNGNLAELNERLGWERTNATLYQVRTQSKHSKTGKPRVMGDDVARAIEIKMGLQEGWMDTPPTYTELGSPPDARSRAHILLDSIAEEDWPAALRVLDALAQPTQKNGTR